MWPGTDTEAPQQPCRVPGLAFFRISALSLLWSQEDEMAAYCGVEKIDMKHLERH